ncbi:MAG: metallophosphoesterase family protein [Bacteroidetes bacterium]|nr:metallophosphoesterase family protein [Bacteroidota bacterium]
MKVGLISDTHGYCDDAFRQYFEACDEIWHAGDLGPGVAEHLSAISPLRAVFGNIDEKEIRAVYPEYLVFNCDEVKVLIIHIAGNPPAFNAVTKKLLNIHRPDLLVYGHSHILRVGKDQNTGLLYINPGAAGQHGFHRKRTLMRIDCIKGKILNAEVVELGNRGSIKPS